ncbi:MAG: aminotransferase class IV family protein [Alphaproteobacteria bacterium]|nr:aminotransferase class IV family protein [Alphaproteobacteria bacterium]MBF0129070.1 aminotransferase class IV family protein [Alphaproteobacteria bacterium]
MQVYLNGILTPDALTRIDPSDRGFTLSDGLFETLRVRAGIPQRLDAHLKRLRAGASLLGLPVPLDDDALTEALISTAAANGLADAVLRLTLTRGPAPRGLLPPGSPSPTLLIVAGPPPPPAGPLYAVVATVTRRNEHSPLSRCKCLAVLDNVLARREAAERGAEDAILLNTAGRLAETTIANLFLVIGGRVMTPPVEEGALPGVRRAEVISRLDAVETPLDPGDLPRAEEAFVTNALGVRPLVAVNERPVGDGRAGPLTCRLLLPE